VEVVPEGLRRYPTKAGREALAARLGLTIDPYSQDWEWEVADPPRFQERLAVYQEATLSEEERISLMEMLIQSVESVARLRGAAQEVEQLGEWLAITPLLRANALLHASTIEYWSLLEADDDPDHQFRVTVAMRRVWAEIKDAIVEQDRFS
jgi:hypothetical protein